MSRPNLAQQASYLFVGRAVAFACVFFLPLFLVRLFDQHTFGLYRQFFVVFYFFFLLGQMGMTQALTALQPKQPQEAPSLLANLTLYLALTGLTAAIIGISLRSTNPASLWSLAHLMGIFVGLMLASSFFEPLLILEQKSRQVALLIIGWDVLRALCMVTAAWWTKDLSAALIAAIAAATLRYLVLLWYLRKEHKLALSALSLPIFLRQLRMALPLSLQSIAHLVETHVDRYLVLFFFSPAAFAIYTIGVFQVPIVDMVFHSIAGVVLPRLVELFGRGERAQMFALWNDTIRRSAWIFLPMCSALFLIHSELLLLLFTHKYAASIPLFGIFVWIIPTYIVSNNSLLQAAEHAWYLTLAGLLKPAIAVVLVLYGLHWWGLQGAVIALVCYHYLAVFLYLWLSARALDVSIASLFPTTSVVAIVIITATAAIPAWWLSSFLVLDIWKLLCKSAVFGVAFLLLTRAVSGWLPSADREDLAMAGTWLQGHIQRMRPRQ